MKKIIIWTVFCHVLINGVSGLRCYSCSGINDNDACNDEGTMECSNGESCYTRIERLESIGTQYFKGCRSRSQCEGLEDLNDADICDFNPSECWYCCNSEDLCNEANTAVTIATFVWTGILQTCTVLGFLYVKSYQQ